MRSHLRLCGFMLTCTGAVVTVRSRYQFVDQDRDMSHYDLSEEVKWMALAAAGCWYCISVCFVSAHYVCEPRVCACMCHMYSIRPKVSTFNLGLILLCFIAQVRFNIFFKERKTRQCILEHIVSMPRYYKKIICK